MIYDIVGGGVLLLFFMCLLLLAVLHKLTMFSFNVDHIRLFCHTYLKTPNAIEVLFIVMMMDF